MLSLQKCEKLSSYHVMFIIYGNALGIERSAKKSYRRGRRIVKGFVAFRKS